MQNSKENKTGNTMKQLLPVQYWLFRKNKLNLLLIIGLLLAGTYALYQGFLFKQKQVATIEAFVQEKKSNLNELTSALSADTSNEAGKEAYLKAAIPTMANWHILLPVAKAPTTTSIFAIGQADVFPYYYTIKAESFFMQLFKQGEISNPLRSLAGHFDTSFWIIYLLPLLIIILGFNALSAEIDNGNWKIINSQGVSAKKWLQSKFLLIGLFVELLLLTIVVAGLLINYYSFKQQPSLSNFYFFVAANSYLFFWIAVVYAINAYRKSSGSNAMNCGIAWAAICILLPALATVAIEKTVPVDNSAISRMSRRPQGSIFDDTTFGKNLILQYSKVHPLNEKTTITPASPPYPFVIYLCYHSLMDDSNSVKVSHYFKQIEKRQQLVTSSIFLNPAAGIDGIFSGLSNNDAVANHSFIWQAKSFHQQLHNAYFPALFFDRKLTWEDYNRFPSFKYSNAKLKSSFVIYILLLLLTAIAIFFGANKKISK